MLKLLVAFFAICSFTAGSLYAKTVMTFAYEDGQQAPYYMGKGTKVLDKDPGVSIEMIKIVAKKMGNIEVKFVRQPWKRCLASLKDGSVDGIFNASYKKKREEFGSYPMASGKPDTSKRITTISYSAYKLKGSKIGWDGKVFSNVKGRVAAPSGYSIISKLKGKFKLKVDDGSKTTDQNFKKLIAGRVSAAVDQELPGDSVLESSNLFSSKIEKMTPPLVTKPYYVMISYQFIKKNPDVANKFWEVIAEVRESQLKKLFKKYQK